DGERVKKVRESTTTIYLEGLWEEEINGTQTIIYEFNGQAVATRKGGSTDVTYLHGDHLGSISLTSGAVESQQEFDPWGVVHQGGIDSSTTTLNFTGQRRDDTGLLYYHARYYDPRLGRFLSPDILVPDPANPQDWNRYTYVRNNPMNATDPTGHYVEMSKQEAAEFVGLILNPVIRALEKNDVTTVQNVINAGLTAAGALKPAIGVVAALAGLAVNEAFDGSQADLKALRFLSQQLGIFNDVADGYDDLSIRIGTISHLMHVEKCLGGDWICKAARAEIYVDWSLPNGAGPPPQTEPISYDLLTALNEYVGAPRYERYNCLWGAGQLLCEHHSTIPDYDGPGVEGPTVGRDPWDFVEED
ncbi:MAG: RHS repeat-associated core domain-containing protein, partial [Chloroflexota bacterium]